jgi:catechol 2,3-dioxygenase
MLILRQLNKVHSEFSILSQPAGQSSFAVSGGGFSPPAHRGNLMNTKTTVHPKLQHYGLATGNLEAMLDWYRKVVGVTVNHRSAVPARAQGRAPFSAVAFTSNDEVNHRIVFFEVPGLAADPDKSRHTRVQHVAFEYQTLDDLLGTYARLKGLGIMPSFEVHEGFQLTFYYEDPDQNVVELNANVYGNDWTATEHMRSAESMAQLLPVDPDKIIAARKAGASVWDAHERILTGEFAATGAWRPIF